jgi:hypothetical protein
MQILDIRQDTSLYRSLNEEKKAILFANIHWQVVVESHVTHHRDVGTVIIFNYLNWLTVVKNSGPSVSVIFSRWPIVLSSAVNPQKLRNMSRTREMTKRVLMGILIIKKWDRASNNKLETSKNVFSGLCPT